MPRFAANLSMLYNEHPFLDRFGAAARDGFEAVEFLFPYEFPAAELAARLAAHGHIGIVTNPKGMKSDFIHSTSGRDMKVVISSLKNRSYKQRFVKAVSVIN